MTEQETLDLFRKLKPLYGARIDRLWTAFAVSDRKEREAIVDILRIMEASVLRRGPDDRTVDLPPPPADFGKGRFHLGTVLFHGKPVGDFSLRDTTDLRQHLSVFGRSGAGKTNLLFHLLRGFQAEKVPFWIFDWKRDYRPLLQLGSERKPIVLTLGRPLAPFRFNALDPPPGSEAEMGAYHDRLIDVIGRAFYVGDGVKSLLRKGLQTLRAKWRENPEENPLNFKMLLHWIDQYTPLQRTKGRRSGDWAESTLRALESLCLGEFGRAMNPERGLDMATLLKHNVIFELDALADDQKVFFVESLLLWLRQYLLNRSEEADRNELKLVLVIEEAHHILKSGREDALRESQLETTLRETRSLGMGLILVDQTPSLIDRVAFANTFTSVFFSLKGRQDIRAAADALLLTRDQEDYLGRLPVGEALVKLQDRWFDPFLIRVPHIEEKDRPVKEEEVSARYRSVREEIRGDSGDSAPIRGVDGENGPDSPSRVPEREESPSLEPVDLNMLQGVLTDPLAGISQRYRKLGVSTRHGNESKDRLLEAGLVRVVEVARPTGQIKLLELTDAGQETLREAGLSDGARLRNGAEHRYWKEAVAEHFRGLGYAVTVEKVVTDGKRVDAEAVRGDERLAIEVETGRSKSTSNFALVLLHYHRLIVLVTDETARRKVEGVLNVLPEHHRERVTVWSPLDLARRTVNGR